MHFSQRKIQSQMCPNLRTPTWPRWKMARKRKQSIELPEHVHHVKARGKDYFYVNIGRGTKAQQPRQRLPDDPRSPEFWAAYRAAIGAPDPQQKQNIFNALIDNYQKSPQFAQLAASTQCNYRRYHETIRIAWGYLDVADIEAKHVLALQDKHHDKVASANSLIRCLSSLLRWSVPRGYRSDNPCLCVDQLKEGDGWAPWPWETIELVEKHGPAWMWQATALALFTGQRQGDVLAMSRSKVRNGLIEVRQQKTGRQLLIPATKSS